MAYGTGQYNVMGVIENLRKRVAEYNDGLTSGLYISNIIKENEAYIVDMNSQVQLYEQGVNRLGVKIADYQPYVPLTIRIKRMKGQPTDRVTLRDTGDFHASFYLVIGSESFEVKASDDKTETLIRKYGRQILGLTDENIAEVIWEYIYPELLEKARTTIL
ncbi:MAG: hypothetical protein NC344_06870 [Bacteroidales bacterium]|nr:hypothetical protein [Bacteroidales bacterium]MCM1147539.1 hypothetical protein [Bacteroidales bacterium]MCM1206329.1 hypothetical protein [Bacillota bacterium]MCM1511243.1 hypothetical protein [Clostridium sp.]